jgi:hypothetical protein
MIVGGVIGWAINSATGADNKYTGSVHLEMKPSTAQQPPAPVPVPPAKDGKTQTAPMS